MSFPLQIMYNAIKHQLNLYYWPNTFHFILDIFIVIILVNIGDLHITNNILDLQSFINVGRYSVQLWTLRQLVILLVTIKMYFASLSLVFCRKEIACWLVVSLTLHLALIITHTWYNPYNNILLIYKELPDSLNKMGCNKKCKSTDCQLERNITST